jgi:hypothetical protein
MQLSVQKPLGLPPRSPHDHFAAGEEDDQDQRGYH